MDLMSKSDPFVQVSIKNGSAPFGLVGSTETLLNNHDPVFRRAIVADFYYEVLQEVKAAVFDQDDDSSEYLGEATFNMADVLMAGPKGLTLKLGGGSHVRGSVTVRFRKIPQNNRLYSFKIHCRNVKDIEWFSKSDPFIRILKPALGWESTPASQLTIDKWTIVHDTEHYDDNLNPVFLPFTLPAWRLDAQFPDLPIRWEIWDWEKDQIHRCIGGITSTMSQLRPGTSLHTVDKKGKPAGDIIFDSFESRDIFQISDYIRMGVRFSLSLAVDFTASNGKQTLKESLHYFPAESLFNPAKMNQYQRAIKEVGDIVLAYDEDKMVPCFGFGAILAGQEKASDLFPISLTEDQIELQGIDGVLEAYRQCLPNIQLSGPTNFSPFLNRSLEAIREQTAQNPLIYHILLIITDGLISDFQETITSLVNLSQWPVSVIIIGVGPANFKSMNHLDSDGSLLKNQFGQTALRDIVQFVPFRDFLHNPQQLAREVLIELPAQVDDYYFHAKKRPEPDHKPHSSSWF